jgi:hypothetical protein
LHTGEKLEALRERLQDTSPPLDSNGQPQPHDAALENMLAVLDWDGRMCLSKPPEQPGAKATAIDRMRWDLFKHPGKTLQEIAKGMHSPHHTCAQHTAWHTAMYLLFTALRAYFCQQ